MKKIFTILFAGFSMLSLAQNELKDHQNQQPLYLVDGVISGYDFSKKINPNAIESMSVYKSNSNGQPEGFEAHLKNGIIDIKMKKYQEQFTKVPLHALNSMYQLPAETPVYVNGLLVKNNKVEIFNHAIAEIQVTNNDSERVLNIILSDKENARRFIFPNSTETPKDKNKPSYIKQIK